MPNRILREGIISSKRMAALFDEASWLGEVFYRRLMSKVDDFGRYSADPALLRPELFPRQLDKVRESDITRLLAVCEKAGLISLYALSGETYLEMLDFRQQTRAITSKFPSRDGTMSSTCAADDTHLRPYSSTGTSTDTKTGARGFSFAEEDSPDPIKRLEGWELSGLSEKLATASFRKAYSEWILGLREAGKKFTPMMNRKQIAFLSGMSHDDAILAVENSTRNGYLGIFDQNGKSKSGSSAPEPRRIKSSKATFVNT